LVYKCRSPDKTFWFYGVEKFRPDDGNACELIVSKIGKNDRLGIGFFVFSADERAMIDHNFEEYFL